MVTFSRNRLPHININIHQTPVSSFPVGTEFVFDTIHLENKRSSFGEGKEWVNDKINGKLNNGQCFIFHMRHYINSCKSSSPMYLDEGEDKVIIPRRIKILSHEENYTHIELIYD